MAASDRKGRYRRGEPEAPAPVTPLKLEILRAVAELRVASTGQLARWLGVSVVAARRHLRALFDGGLVRVVPCGRWQLSGPGTPFDPSLLYGSAENLYVLDREGARLLSSITGERPVVVTEGFGPGSTPFLAHLLAVRDVRVWLQEALRRHPGHRLEAWRQDADARVPLTAGCRPAAVLPDAWFAYRLGRQVLVALVEADRGTEGPGAWKDKLAGYRQLFGSPALKAATGYAQGRVLVTVPDGGRRDRLARLVRDEADEALAGRFWLAAHGDLPEAGMAGAAWRRPGAEDLAPLVPAALLEEGAGVERRPR